MIAGLVVWCAIAAAGCAGGGDSESPTGPSDASTAQAVVWSIDFGTTATNSLDVSACNVSFDGGFCSQIIHVDASGAFHDVWSPATPNVLQADGMLSATAVSATLKCVSTAARGSLSATASGAEYTGTATLSGRTVPIRVYRGTGRC
jgi:hypothetical protein